MNKIFKFIFLNSDLDYFECIFGSATGSLLDITRRTGIYYAVGATDLPTGTISDYGFLFVMSRNDNYNYKKIIWTPYISNVWFANSCNNGEWSGWTQIV